MSLQEAIMLKGYDFKYAALQGGGAKGEGHIGVLRGLKRLGLYDHFEAISGASAGAINSLIWATGWSMEKIEAFTKDLDFGNLATGGAWDKVKVPYTEHYYFGLFHATEFYNLFKKVIKEVSGNENCSFREWHDLISQKPELKDISVQAFNNNTGMNETFAWDTIHADVPIADALRASMAFPVVFTPWPIGTFTYKENGTKKSAPLYYSDGGIQKNCPYDVFQKKPGEFNPQVLSVKLGSFERIKYIDKGIPLQPKPKTTALQIHLAQFEGALDAQDALFKDTAYEENAIYVDTLNVGTLDFNLSQEQKEALQASGEYSVIRFFYKLDPQLVASKYDKETLDILKEARFPICFTELMQKHALPEDFLSAQAKPSKVSSSNAAENLGENIVSLSDHKQKKQSYTPLFHQWSRNTSLRSECKRLNDLEAKHCHKEEKKKAKTAV